MDAIMILIWVVGAGVLVLMWLMFKEVFNDLFIIIKKDSGILLAKGKAKNGIVSIGQHEYPVVSEAAHSDRGRFFWRKIFVFDEGSTKPRRLDVGEDNWLDSSSVKKMINTEFINGVVTSMMGLLNSKKIMSLLFMVAAVSFINMAAAVVMLAIQLKLFG